jgi:hypothetical protein
MTTSSFASVYFKVARTTRSSNYDINFNWTTEQFISIMREKVLNDFNLENVEFVDTMLARDSRALREYIKEVQPDVDLTFFPNGSNEKVSIPVGLSFFWPDL